MKLIQCRKKHYYDADKFASCPHCAVYNKTAENTDDKEENKPAKEVAVSLEEGLADSVEKVMRKINKQ